MAIVRFSVLDVGQGTGQLIEAFEGSNTDKADVAMLIDLGSSQDPHGVTVTAVDYAAQRVAKMTPPVLESVLFSHPDRDHVNLVKAFVEKFTHGGLTVKNIWFGGDRTGYIKNVKGVNYDYLAALDAFRPGAPFSESVIHNISLRASSIRDNDADKWKPIAAAKDLKVYLVSGNALFGTTAFNYKTTDPKPARDGFRANSSSLILMVTYKDNWIIAMGDATGLSMAVANQIVGTRVKNVLHVTLPHHGSAVSTWDLRAAIDGVDDPADYTVKRFVNHLRPITISASAWEYGTWGHPAMKVVDAFSPYLNPNGIDIWADNKLGSDQHAITVYFPAGKKALEGGTGTAWPRANGWRSVRTHKPIFTTDYAIRGEPLPGWDPPSATLKRVSGNAPTGLDRAQAWAIEVDQASKVRIRPLVKTSAMMALPRHHAEALLGGPVPEDEDFVLLPTAAQLADAGFEAPPEPVVRPAEGAPPTDVPPPAPRRMRQVS